MGADFAPTGRRLVGGTGRILVAEALTLPSGLAVTVFLTRRLGPAV